MTERELLRQGGASLGLELSDVQVDRLLQFAQLILKWNKVYNLTALRDPALVLTHHLLDSLASVVPLARECNGAGKLLDVGSGAGLPGVVVAVMRDDLDVTCLDAVAKKTAFVQQVAAELKLQNLQAVHQRVEDHQGAYAIVCSRAFASLSDFFSGSEHLLGTDGKWMALKGKVPSQELAGLATNVEMFHVEQLKVPGLDADRCIVWARRRDA